MFLPCKAYLTSSLLNPQGICSPVQFPPSPLLTGWGWVRAQRLCDNFTLLPILRVAGSCRCAGWTPCWRLVCGPLQAFLPPCVCSDPHVPKAWIPVPGPCVHSSLGKDVLSTAWASVLGTLSQRTAKTLGITEAQGSAGECLDVSEPGPKPLSNQAELPAMMGPWATVVKKQPRESPNTASQSPLWQSGLLARTSHTESYNQRPQRKPCPPVVG